jgi:CubicO group peptidase (beta-lactamase class C family)
MRARVAKGEMPGLVMLVERGGETEVSVIGNMAFGDDGKPMRRDTIFRVASLTKPVTAVAAMMLVEDGVLALDEPVEKFLPELADRRVLTRLDGPLTETTPADRPITLEDLLTFRMGHGLITEPDFQPRWPVVTAAEKMDLVLAQPDPRTEHTPDEWMRLFGLLPLMCQPGQRWQYNTGTLILGVLIARASGKSLEAFMRERIFEPLAMTETGFSVDAGKTHRMPVYYISGTEPGPDAQWTQPPEFPSGSSGLASTLDDYLAFARMMLRRGAHEGKQLLGERSVELMTANHLTPEQIASAGIILGGRGWGYGMSVVDGPDGRYGWEGGSGTLWFNGDDVIAIALTQCTDFLFGGAAEEFTSLVMGG